MAPSPSAFKTEILIRQKERAPVFFFDFDGTLAEIEQTPDKVTFRPIARFIVAELAKNYTVGIITGRALREIKKLVGINGIFYSGNHGVEIDGPGLRFVEKNSASSAKFIGSLVQTIRRKLKPYGAIVQPKKYSVAVHYRTVEPGLVRNLLDDLEAITRAPVKAGKIKLQLGKKVVELKPPVEWDKGKAIEKIVRECGHTGRVFFFGDDMTDEYGFKKVNELRGVSVFVGPLERETAAKYRLDSPSALVGELAKFLFKSE